MHPKIVKFWLNNGYVIIDRLDHGQTLYFANPLDLEKESIQVALMTEAWDSPVYLLGEAAYEEERMLRIIKLKAFL